MRAHGELSSLWLGGPLAGARPPVQGWSGGTGALWISRRRAWLSGLPSPHSESAVCPERQPPWPPDRQGWRVGAEWRLELWHGVAGLWCETVLSSRATFSRCPARVSDIRTWCVLEGTRPRASSSELREFVLLHLSCRCPPPLGQCLTGPPCLSPTPLAEAGSRPCSRAPGWRIVNSRLSPI